MRIAQFVQRYPPALGGSESYIERLSRHWVRSGHEVTVWTTNALDLSAFWSPSGSTHRAGISVEHGINVRRYPLWRMRGRRWLLKPLSLIPQRTWQALTLPCNPISLSMWRDAGRAADRFDAVHACAFPYAWPIVCARRLARRLSIPFFLTPFLHLGDPQTRRQYTQPALRRLLRSADGVFVQTELEREAAIDLGVDPVRISLQGLGVEPAECTGGDRSRARHHWGIVDDTVVIGHLANLSVEKGSVDLLHAINGIDNVATVLAGPSMPNYRQFRQTYRSSARIIEPGVLTDDQRRDFYAGIDIFALPSRSDSFGLVLLEAWANGKPVVVYQAGGPAELVRDGTDGLLARCGDIEELAVRMQLLVKNANLRRQFGEAGRRRCAVDFRWTDKLRIVTEAIEKQTEPEASATAIDDRRLRVRPPII